MAFSFDLPESIPVFPLPKAVLLPRSRLPLHIFEPRYLSMIEDAMKTPGRLIGMIQPAGEDRLHTIGCAGRLTQFSETDDGRYMITLTGVSRYRLQDEIEGFTPYRKFNVVWDGFDADRKNAESDKGLNREALFELLQLFRRDREWNDGAAKEQLFTIFDALKANDPIVLNGRRKLSSMIFA